jgi:hypothetical protein
VGDHKVNGRAIQKAQEQPGGHPEEIWGCDMEAVVELNAATIAEITRITDLAKQVGDDPREALHKASIDLNPMRHPDKYDVVIYVRAQCMRPSRLIAATGQQPVALLRGPELWRASLKSLRERADTGLARARGEPEPNLQ